MATPPPTIRIRGGVHTLVPAPAAPVAVPLARVLPANDGGLPILSAALKSTRLTTAFAERRLTAAQADRLGRTIAARGKAATRLATADLVAGKTTLDRWRARMKAETVAAAGAAARAKLGSRNLAAADRRALEDALHRQLGYLDRFAAGLKDGTIPRDAAAVARAGLYGAAAWSTAEAVAADRAEREGMDQERSQLGVADHCSTCVEEAARGWVEIGSLIPIGERDCLSNCRCTIEFRRAPATKAAARRKPVAKPEPRPEPEPEPRPEPVDARAAELQRLKAAEVQARAEYDRLKGGGYTPELQAARDAWLEAGQRARDFEAGIASPALARPQPQPQPQPVARPAPTPGPWRPATTLAEAETWGAAHGVRAIPESPRPVTLAEWNAVNAEVAKLPRAMLDRIASVGGRLDILNGEGITDHPDRANLKGVTPRGWAAGTWDTTPGVGAETPGRPTIVVANKLTTGHGALNLTIHEHAHSFDYAHRADGGQPLSQTAEWQALHRSVTWSDPYFSNHPEEGFARMFEEYYHSPETRARMDPRLVPYLERLFP